MKAYFSNKKYSVTIQTHPKQILYNINFLNITSVQYQLPITFGKALAYNKILRLEILPSHMNF